MNFTTAHSRQVRTDHAGPNREFGPGPLDEIDHLLPCSISTRYANFDAHKAVLREKPRLWLNLT
jgi:hypothetical protein